MINSTPPKKTGTMIPHGRGDTYVQAYLHQLIWCYFVYFVCITGGGGGDGGYGGGCGLRAREGGDHCGGVGHRRESYRPNYFEASR